MPGDITHYEILRNRQLSRDGMATDCAVRNFSDMKRLGMIAARKRAGLTQEQVAERMGVSTPQISRWETGKDGIPSQRLSAMTEAYEADINELFDNTDVPISDVMPQPNAKVLRYEGANNVVLPRDVPVFGSTLGAPLEFCGKAVEQAMLNSGNIIDYLPRPSVLNGQKAAYGLYVQGSSMAPRFEDGETVFATDSSSAKPPRIHDYVVLYLRDEDEDDGQRAQAVLIKRLIKRTASYYELEQFNPPVTFQIPAEKVLRVDRVIPWSELIS